MSWALTRKYTPEFHEQIYQHAVSKALSSGEPNRARQIISEMAQLRIAQSLLAGAHPTHRIMTRRFVRLNSR